MYFKPLQALYLLLPFIPLFTQAQNIELDWAARTGTFTNDDARAVAVDSMGNSYTLGTFRGTVDFDPGVTSMNLTATSGDDIYIQKLDALGNFVWAKAFGSANNDRAEDLQIDHAGNLIVIGRINTNMDLDPGPGSTVLTTAGSEDAFVQKLDEDGNFIWAKSFGGSALDKVLAVAIDQSNNIYTGGYFNDTADFDPSASTFNLISNGSNDAFIQKLNSNGDFVWAKAVGNASIDRTTGLAVMSSGNVVASGSFIDSVDFDPGSDSTFASSAGQNDGFVLQLDVNGEFVWVKTFGGSSFDTPGPIAIDADDNVIVAGNFRGNSDFDPGANTFNLSSTPFGQDFFILKLDSDGSFNWATSAGTGSEIINDIATDGFGNIYTAGVFAGEVDFDPGIDTALLDVNGSGDGFIYKLSSAGTFGWVTSLGGTSNDAALGIALDADQNVYTVGFFSSTMDVDPTINVNNITSSGSLDAFVQKLNQICPALTGVDTQTACDSFTWIDGITYTSNNNTATYTLTNLLGCDSVVTLDLTIGAPTAGTDVQSACDSFTWIDGNTYTQDNDNATFTLTNAAGCDSVVTLHLSIFSSSQGTDVQTACGSFTWIDGNTYTSNNNTATFTLPNAAGCDSIVTLNLTVINLNTSVTLNNGVLTSNAVTGTTTYQWLDCGNAFAPIAGETSGIFTPTSNGSYAVEVSENGCVDTSSCTTVTNVGIASILNQQLAIYPNPSSGIVHINSPFPITNVRVLDLTGKAVKLSTISNQTIDISDLQTGVYFIEVWVNEQKATRRLIKH